MHLFVVSSQVYIQWVRHTRGSLEWIISMHPAELWWQSSLVDFQSSRIKTKKTSSFPTPLHPYLLPYFFYQIWHVHVLLTFPCLLPYLFISMNKHEFISNPSSDLLVSLPPPGFSVSSLAEHMRHTPESLGQSRIRAERAT